MSKFKRNPEWDAAVVAAPDFDCGRLDAASYTLDGVMMRNIYLYPPGVEITEHNIDDLMVRSINGQWCDEIAYAACVGQQVLRAMTANAES